MKIIEQGEWEFVTFTYDEELEFAKWVMDVLCLPWIQTRPEFSKLISRVYALKCHGKDLTGEEFADLLKYTERYDELLPDLPLFDEKAGAIKLAPTRHGKRTREERKNYLVHEIIRAWKEAWKAHPRIKKAVEGCDIFAGDEILDPEQAKIAYQNRQRARERAFYEEVIRRQAKHGITRQEAIQAVSDTHPRADDDDLRWDMTKV